MENKFHQNRQICTINMYICTTYCIHKRTESNSNCSYANVDVVYSHVSCALSHPIHIVWVPYITMNARTISRHLFSYNMRWCAKSFQDAKKEIKICKQCRMAQMNDFLRFHFSFFFSPPLFGCRSFSS